MKLLALILPAAMAVYGARLLFRTHGQLTSSLAAHRHRVEDRLSRGSDAYADELRSLESYPPIKNLWQRRLFGILILAASLAYIIFFIISSE